MVFLQSGGINEQVVNVQSEYFQGSMYLNGVNAGDRVTIIDDTLSTGGAVIALVNAVKGAGGELVDVICAVEKVGNNGAEKVKKQTGIDVKTIMKIVVRDEGVNVIS
ncbi:MULTISPECIES: hypothetical protein [unclassified Pseudomonas]|uniref:hypothetical protein n=1 Tax=unclassified Pseudomonas TaxID=196821 RepID=UPI002115A0AF|nr:MULTISPECIES: hypothetical protein [unclassified Pseudomonas]